MSNKTNFRQEETEFVRLQDNLNKVKRHLLVGRFGRDRVK